MVWCLVAAALESEPRVVCKQWEAFMAKKRDKAVAAHRKKSRFKKRDSNETRRAAVHARVTQRATDARRNVIKRQPYASTEHGAVYSEPKERAPTARASKRVKMQDGQKLVAGQGPKCVTRGTEPSRVERRWSEQDKEQALFRKSKLDVLPEGRTESVIPRSGDWLLKDAMILQTGRLPCARCVSRCRTACRNEAAYIDVKCGACSTLEEGVGRANVIHPQSFAGLCNFLNVATEGRIVMTPRATAVYYRVARVMGLAFLSRTSTQHVQRAISDHLGSARLGPVRTQ